MSLPGLLFTWAVTVAAFVGYAALVAVAFGIRTVIHYRRFGRSGWLVPPTRAAAVGDVLFSVGVGEGIVGSMLGAVEVLRPFEVLNRPVADIAGGVALIGGSIFALVAQAQMGRSWRAGIDVSHDYELVTRGLFGLVRNPFYTGFIVASVGVFLMSPNLVTLLGWVMLVAGCEVDVRLVEEPHLRATRGNDYSEYEKRVPRFIPRLGSSM